jgi:hypothetical protein
MTEATYPRPWHNRSRNLLRLLLLAFVLVAFGRVTWELDAKNLWWDESLSLQRAESAWPALLQGHLVLVDGINELLTIDQHPFLFFALAGLLLRLAGDSEYVLRFVSVMAVTIFVPVAYATAGALVRRGVLPRTTPAWAAGITAVTPFLLWYGQEARPYALWTLLALLSTYLLLRVTESPQLVWPWFGSYLVVMGLFLVTHYFAVFLLPVHALLFFFWLAGRRPWLATGLAAAMLGLGAMVGAFAFWFIIVRQGGGGNFSSVAWDILAPDLLNAFSMGLSVDITQVWWLDLLAGGVALVGLAWGVRSRRALLAGGWLLPAMVLGPVFLLLWVNLFYPAYMTARHMALIGGGYWLLLAGGLALLAQWRWWSAVLVAVPLSLGIGYSTLNYFTVEKYAKDDYASLGSYLSKRLADGDLVLVKSPFAWRIFYYYAGLDVLDRAAAAGAHVRFLGVPQLRPLRGNQLASLEAAHRDYRRTWLLISGTHSFADPAGEVEAWLGENMFKVSDVEFFCHCELRAQLYLPDIPVTFDTPTSMQQRVTVDFGEQIRLIGYDVGTPHSQEMGLPVTLYWQALAPIDQRYKYVLAWVRHDEDGEVMIAVTEREPYDGVIATLFWAPEQTIIEYTELPAAAWPTPEELSTGRYSLQLQVYHAETLEKLPVTQAGGVAGGDEAALLPFPGQ